MTPEELHALATVASLFLVIWELLRLRWPGAVLGALSLTSLVTGSETVHLLFAIVLALPVVFEERWHPRARKDMVRAVLAAAVIAPCVALLVLR